MRIPEREEDVQATIIDGLTRLGYRVLQTTVRHRRCKNCGAPPAGNYGATPGVPDILFTRDDWAIGAWIGIEVKGTKTRLSDAQRELAGAGRIYVCRSWDDCEAVVETVEGRVK